MPSHPPPPRLEPGAKVRTPSGRFAEIIAVYHEEGEALVKWQDGQVARFRVTLLRGLPGL